MNVVNRGIVKKDNEYFVIEEIINSRTAMEKLKINNPDCYYIFRNSDMIYRDANTKKFVNVIDYEGCSYVNTRNMSSIEFVNSEFFKKNKETIVLTLSKIICKYKKVDPKSFVQNNELNYKMLESVYFLTSDFCKKHYEEIFNTLDNISIERKNNKSVIRKLFRCLIRK